jgi:hypothetical protein
MSIPGFSSSKGSSTVLTLLLGGSLKLPSATDGFASACPD